MKTIVIKKQPDGRVELSIDGMTRVCDTWEEAIKKAEEQKGGDAD